MRPRVAIVVLALLVAGCSGDSNKVPHSALSALVLQPSDLPSAFQQFDEGQQSRADAPGGARAEAGRFGRIGGWKSRYRRGGGVDTQGPLVIESRADLFESGGGAKDELEEISRETGVEPADRGLGDDVVVVRKAQAGFPRRLVTFVVAWRSDNVVGSITANGFQGRLNKADALQLARKQQARIAAETR
jgi:hypothetical protein